MKKKRLIELTRDIIAVLKGGFEAFSSSLWLGVAIILFNNISFQYGLDYHINNITSWILCSMFVSFVFYSVVNINQLTYNK